MGYENSHVIPTLFPRYSHVIPTLFPRYSLVNPYLLPSYGTIHIQSTLHSTKYLYTYLPPQERKRETITRNLQGNYKENHTLSSSKITHYHLAKSPHHTLSSSPQRNYHNSI